MPFDDAQFDQEFFGEGFDQSSFDDEFFGEGFDQEGFDDKFFNEPSRLMPSVSGGYGLTTPEPVDPTERTWGEIASDTAAGFGTGAGHVLGGLGTLYGLATGDMDNWAREHGERVSEYWKERQSPQLQALKAKRKAAVDAAPNEFEKGVAAFWETVSEPALLGDFAAEQIPMFVPGMGLGRAAGTAGRAAGLSTGAAGKVATGTAVTSGAGLQAADVAGEAYDQLMQLEEAVWSRSAAYQDALDAGMKPEEAKHAIAMELTRQSGAAAGGISLATNLLPGSRIFERALAGAPGRTRGGLVSRAAKGALGEGLQEAVEEGSGQAIQNIAVGQVDPTREALEGVGEAAGMGLAAGVFGIPAGVAGKPGEPRQRRKRPGPPPGPPGPATTDVQTQAPPQVSSYGLGPLLPGVGGTVEAAALPPPSAYSRIDDIQRPAGTPVDFSAGADLPIVTEEELAAMEADPAIEVGVAAAQAERESQAEALQQAPPLRDLEINTLTGEISQEVVETLRQHEPAYDDYDAYEGMGGPGGVYLQDMFEEAIEAGADLQALEAIFMDQEALGLAGVETEVTRLIDEVRHAERAQAAAAPGAETGLPSDVVEHREEPARSETTPAAERKPAVVPAVEREEPTVTPEAERARGRETLPVVAAATGESPRTPVRGEADVGAAPGAQLGVGGAATRQRSQRSLDEALTEALEPGKEQWDSLRQTGAGNEALGQELASYFDLAGQGREGADWKASGGRRAALGKGTPMFFHGGQRLVGLDAIEAARRVLQIPEPQAAGYEQRWKDREKRAKAAKTSEAAEAILQEEYTDAERHIEGTGRVERAVRRATAKKREAERRQAEIDGQRAEDDRVSRLEKAKTDADITAILAEEEAGTASRNPERVKKVADDRRLTLELEAWPDSKRAQVLEAIDAKDNKALAELLPTNAHRYKFRSMTGHAVIGLPQKGGLQPFEGVSLKGRDWLNKRTAEVEPKRKTIEEARKEAATSPENDLPAPTEDQIKADNYAKGHIQRHGLKISIENPKGSTRSGTDRDGKKWSVTMAHDYGDIKGTRGLDKDHLDVFLGPQFENEQGRVFIVDQVDPKTGKPDEHKIMIGFGNKRAARRGYLANYKKGWQGLGAITGMSMPEFKEWLASGKTTRPVSDEIANRAESKDAKTVRGDKGRLPAEGRKQEGVPEKGGADLQRAAQTRPAAGRADEDVEAPWLYGRKAPEDIFPPPTKKQRAEEKAGDPISQKEANERVEGWKAEAQRMGREEDHSNEVVLSLFDRTGNWSRPYEEAGYDVRKFDIETGQDLIEYFPIIEIEEIRRSGKTIVGVLAAPPCTSYACSGARWWSEQHDKPGKENLEKKYGWYAPRYFDTPLEYANTLVAIVDSVIEYSNPTLFHVLENPVGRIAKEAKLPAPTLAFDPHHYGDPFTKRTQLWGNFNPDLPTANVEPTEGSRVHRLSSSAQAKRTETPEGFAYAFFMANNTSGAKQQPKIPKRIRTALERMVQPVKEVAEGLKKARKLGDRYAAEYLTADREAQVKTAMDKLEERLASIPDADRQRAARTYVASIIPDSLEYTLNRSESEFFAKEPEANYAEEAEQASYMQLISTVERTEKEQAARQERLKDPKVMREYAEEAGIPVSEMTALTRENHARGEQILAAYRPVLERREKPDTSGVKFTPVEEEVLEAEFEETGGEQVVTFPYMAGMNRPRDFEAALEAGGGVGVVIGELSQPMKRRISAALEAGQQVFVDSGAFSAYQKVAREGGDLKAMKLADWAKQFDKVMENYKKLSDQVRETKGGRDNAAGLMLVMPDVIGDQVMTWGLLTKYYDQIKDLQRAGHELIVPLQTGGQSAYEFWDSIRTQVFDGTADFVAGIPSNKEAMPDAELLDFIKRANQPARLHILGAVSPGNKRYQARMETIKQGYVDDVPGVTADAMRLRAVLNRLQGLKGQEKQDAMAKALAEAVPEQYQQQAKAKAAAQQPGPGLQGVREEAPKGGQVRAKAGGQVGVNGYLYKGGRFLPSTTAPPGTWRIKAKKGTKVIRPKNELISPGVTATQPTPYSRPIFPMIRYLTSEKTDGSLAPTTDEQLIQNFTHDGIVKTHAHGMKGPEYTLEDLVDLYNRGARWIDVNPDQEGVVAKGEPKAPAAEPEVAAQAAEDRAFAIQQARSERGKALALKARQVKDNDSLTVAVAKLGGISSQDAEAFGFDPADFKRLKSGIYRTFNRNGESFDGMRERLQGYGFNYDTEADLVNALQEENAGNVQRSAQGYEAQAELEHNERLEAMQDAAADILERDGDTAAVIDMTGLIQRAAETIGLERAAEIENELEESGIRMEEADIFDALYAEQLEREIDEYTNNQAGQGGGQRSSEDVLQEYTEEDIRQREAAQEQQRTEEVAENRKAEADAQREGFVLTGSDRAADEAEARGQDTLFDDPATYDAWHQDDTVREERTEYGAKGAKEQSYLSKLKQRERRVINRWLRSQPETDAKRIRADIKRNAGTPWEKQAIDGILFRQAMEDIFAGKNPRHVSIMNAPQNADLKARLLDGKEEAAVRHLRKNKLVGHPEKPVNAVNSSFVNCSPSRECASFCYAATGRSYPVIIAKAELSSWIVETRPEEAAAMAAREYQGSPEFHAEKALRLFDKGDGNDKWLPFIRSMNEQGIRLQVFSKQPEFLRQVPDSNVRLLSVDSSNLDLARSNPDLPIAFVYAGKHQAPLLEEFADRIGVILPVKIGQRVLTKEHIEAIPKKVKPKVCPIDKGSVKVGDWNCTRCDKNGGVGCFHKNVTAKALQAAEKPPTIEETEAIFDEIKRSLALDRYGRGELSALLASLDDVMGAVRERVDIGSEGSGAELSSGGGGGSGDVEISSRVLEDQLPSRRRKDTGIKEEVAGYGKRTGVRDPGGAGVDGVQLSLDLQPAAAVPAVKQARDNFSIGYKLVETGTIRTGLDTVTSPHEAAHVMAPMRKHGQENMIALVTGKGNRVLGLLHHTKGGVDASQVFVAELISAIASVDGAQIVWFGHNHPSGDSRPSKADMLITDRLTQALDGSGIDVAGHIVLAAGRKARFLKHAYDNGYIEIEAAPRTKSIPIKEKKLRKSPPRQVPKITSPETAEDIVRGLDSKNALLLMNNRNHVHGVMSMTAGEMAQLRKGGQVKRVLQGIATTNAKAAIVVTDNIDAGTNLVRYLNTNTHGMSVLDVFTWNGAILHSSAARGAHLEKDKGPFMGRGEPGGVMAGEGAAVFEPEAVERIARRLLKKMGVERSGLKLRVHQSVEGLPPKLRKEVEAQGAAEDVYALLDGQDIHVLADRMGSETDIEVALLHEVYGHWGRTRLFGRAAARKLRAIYRVVGGDAGIRALAERHGFNMEPYFRSAEAGVFAENEGFREAMLADELLAHLAQHGPRSLPGKVVRAVQEWIGAVRQWLRDRGFQLAEWTDADMARVLRHMREAARRPGEAANQVNTSAFKEWFKKSQVVDKKGEPLIVYHGSPEVGFTEFDHGGEREGYWFAVNRDLAEEFREGGEVRSFYLSAQNVFDYRKPAHRKILSEITDRPADEITGRYDEINPYLGDLKDLGFDGAWMSEFPTDQNQLSIAVFDSNQIKSATDNVGTFSARSDDVRFGRGKPTESAKPGSSAQYSVTYEPLEKQTQETRKAAQAEVREVLEERGGDKRFRDAWTRVRSGALGALTLRQLSEVGNKYVPQLKQLVSGMQHYQTARNQMAEEAKGLAEDWQQLPLSQARNLADLMHLATISSVDPAMEKYEPIVDIPWAQDRIRMYKRLIKDTPGERGKIYDRWRTQIRELKTKIRYEKYRQKHRREMERRWAFTDNESRGIYVRARDAYVKMSERMETAIIRRIEEAELAEDVRKQAILKVRQEFEQARHAGPFFPLHRAGQYYLVAKRGVDDEQEHAFYMFSSPAERRRERPAIEAEGWTVTKEGVKDEIAGDLEKVSEQFVVDTVQAMEKRLGSYDARKAQEVLYEQFLTAMPYMSHRIHFIRRKKTPGYSRDALRAYAFNMAHLSNQIARMEVQPEFDKAMNSARKEIKEAEGDVTRSEQILHEMRRRYEWLMNPGGSKWTAWATTTGFLWYLGLTPAAGLVNLSQTAIVAFPELAARYGVGGALKQLNRSMLEVIKARRHLGDRENYAKWAGLSDDERLAFRRFHDDGVIDTTQAQMLMGLAETDSTQYDPRTAKALEIAGWMFQEGEVINRQATLLAGYRLARAKGQSHEEAIEAAEEATWNSHFDYSNANRARWMQSNWAKVLLLFRSYSQHMTYYLARNAFQSLQGESKEVRAEARKKLAGVVGMTGLFAGSVGLPLIGVLFSVLDAAHALFGDDDEPWDAEAEFRSFLADYGLAGKVADRGVFNVLTGADMAARVSLNELWLRSPDRDLDGRDLYAHYVGETIGPLGGIVENAFRAVDVAAEGHYLRAAETALPKALKDPLRAFGRYAQEGVTNYRGDPIVPLEALTPWDIALQAQGFTPDKVRAQWDTNRARKNYEQAILKRRKDLTAGYVLAIMEKDTEAKDEYWSKIVKFNAKNPRIRITQDGIKQSLRTRHRYRREAQHGVHINRRLREQLERVRVPE